MNNTFISRSMDMPPGTIGPLVYFRLAAGDIAQVLRQGLEMHENIRFSLTLEVTFERITGNGRAWIQSRFASMTHAICSEYEIEEAIDEAVNQLMERLSSFMELGSRWSVLSVDACEVKLCCYNSIGGSGYKFVTPPFISKTNATLNIENNDDKCFLYCILAAKHTQANHAERVAKY